MWCQLLRCAVACIGEKRSAGTHIPGTISCSSQSLAMFSSLGSQDGVVFGAGPLACLSIALSAAWLSDAHSSPLFAGPNSFVDPRSAKPSSAALGLAQLALNSFLSTWRCAMVSRGLRNSQAHLRTERGQAVSGVGPRYSTAGLSPMPSPPGDS